MAKHSCCGNLCEPLNGKNGDEEHGKGIDINEVIKKSINLRLPRLSVDGKCEPPPKPPKEDKSDKNGPPASCTARVIACPKNMILYIASSCSSCCGGLKATFCPCSATLQIFMKYSADILTNGLYIAGPTLLASYLASKGKKEGEITEYQAQFIAQAGLAATILMLLKNFRTIMNQFFGIVDTIQEIIDKAIETLKGELLETVREHVSNPVVAPVIAMKLSGGIDQAKEKLQVVKYLPCPIRKRCYFLICFFLPVLMVVLYSNKCVIMPHAATCPPPAESTTAPPTLLSEYVGLIAVPSARSVAQHIKEFWDQHVAPILADKQKRDQIHTVASNLLMAWVASVAMIMVVLNKVMAGIESGINQFMQAKVSEAVNAPKLQEEIDNYGSCSIL